MTTETNPFAMPEPRSHECPQHGPYRAYMHEATCPACAKLLEDEARQLADRWEMFAAWRSSGLPQRLAHKSRSGWKPGNAHDRAAIAVIDGFARQLVDHSMTGRGILLHGGVGTGKSHLLAALLADCIELGASRPRYYVVPDLLAAHRAAQNERITPMDDARAADVLVLDEIAAAPMTEWASAELFRLIDFRHRECRMTLIGTNATADQLPKLIGERAADRLRESCLWLHLSGESKRGKATLPPDPVRFAEPPQEAVSRVWKGDAG